MWQHLCVRPMPPLRHSAATTAVESCRTHYHATITVATTAVMTAWRHDDMMT